jgi:hypothetical protein
MARERLLWCASLSALLTTLGAFGACSSSDGRPSSLVTAGGATNPGGFNGGNANGGNTNDAGPTSNGGSSAGGADADATGEGGSAAPGPVAQFPSQLEADVGCNMTTADAALLITNTGDEPLVVSSASADSGYTVKTALPLEIAPGAGAALLVTPPTPAGDADAGTITGKLSFTTNEPGTPTHVVTLSSALFEGSFEFTDSNGAPITSLELGYGSSISCPDLSKYRIHNTGNVAFTVLGPTFPAHFGGTSLGSNGQAIPPDGYAELMVGGVSTPGTSCSATGSLTFTVMGTFCGSVPTLNVVWPASSDPDAGTSCACTATP